jgi:large subunit ribosomal protein L14
MARRKAAGTARIKLSPGLQVGTQLKCADNSGARIVEIIAVKGYKGRIRRVPFATIGDMVIVTVKKGTPNMRRQILPAIVIRQRKPFRRESGEWLAFEDSAVAIVNPAGDPRGSDIRGPVSREAVSRWPRLSTICSQIV